MNNVDPNIKISVKDATGDVMVEMRKDGSIKWSPQISNERWRNVVLNLFDLTFQRQAKIMGMLQMLLQQKQNPSRIIRPH